MHPLPSILSTAGRAARAWPFFSLYTNGLRLVPPLDSAPRETERKKQLMNCSCWAQLNRRYLAVAGVAEFLLLAKPLQRSVSRSLHTPFLGGEELLGTTMTDAAEKSCRFCLESTDSDADPLIAPCNCDGFSRWVHTQCLMRWQVEV